MGLERLEQFWEPLVQATIQSPFYMQYGLAIVFLYAMTPNALFIPNVAFWTPLFLEAVDPQKFIVMIIFLTGISGFIGDSLLYFGVRKGFHFLSRNFKTKDELKMSHWFHRFHRLIFIISPTIPFLSEGVLIFAAYKKLPFMKFSPFLLLGNFIKNIIEVIAFSSILVGVGMI